MVERWEGRVAQDSLEVGTTRGLLKDRAYEELKESIKTEVFPPGSFLSERQLVKRLGMSKTPIRSALERLESEGFVSVSPQQGILVRELSLQEIVDHYDIRIALETFMTRRLAGRLDEAQEALLRANLEKQAGRAEHGDAVACAQLDAEFHLMLCEFLDNRQILQVMWRLRDKLSRVTLRVFKQQKTRTMQSYAEHAAIVEAIVRGDGEEGARLVEEHLEYGKQFLVS